MTSPKHNPCALSVFPLRTRIFRPTEKLADFIFEHVPTDRVRDSMLIAVTSKIVSLAEGRSVEKSSISKAELLAKEAEHHLGEMGYGCFLTIAHGILLPSAGIDESNSADDHYILYPEDPFRSAKQLWAELRERWSLNHLGVIFTDSRTAPLRRGVTGIALAHWGFRGLHDRRGDSDLFGRPLKMTTVNVVDALAAAAVLGMGEGDEAQPLALIESANVEFSLESTEDQVKVSLEEDLYYPLLAPRLLGKTRAK